jgi:hypothetical protein
MLVAFPLCLLVRTPSDLAFENLALRVTLEGVRPKDGPSKGPRTLLIRHGILSGEEIDALQAEIERAQAETMMERCAPGLDAYQRELLRSLKGQKH